jgi:hypothetical protein
MEAKFKELQGAIQVRSGYADLLFYIQQVTSIKNWSSQRGTMQHLLGKAFGFFTLNWHRSLDPGPLLDVLMPELRNNNGFE